MRDVTLPLWAYVALLVIAWVSGSLFHEPMTNFMGKVWRTARSRLRGKDVVS